MDDFEKGLVRDVRDALRALIKHHELTCVDATMNRCEVTNRAQAQLDGLACSVTLDE